MVWKHTYFWRKNLVSSPGDIREILENFPSSGAVLHSFWGKEFVVFERDDSKIFHPINGSRMLLGISIPITSRNVDQMCELLIDCNSIVMECSSALEGEEVSAHFESCEIKKYRDFSALISILEKNGYASTKKSKCWMTTDGRTFKVTKKSLKCMPSLEEFTKDFIEVDCLGTTLFHELTLNIEKLYLKVTNPKNKDNF